METREERRQRLKEQTIRQLEALKEKKCWVHGNQLIRGITEPSYGLPSGYDAEVQKRYPFHGLFVDLGCLAVPSDQTQGQTANICPICQKEAIVYLDSIEGEEEE